MPDLTAKRTLVKSPPELWEELSEVERLAKHLGAFGEITITKLEPEHTVAWEGEHASGTVSIEPSGWGTKVTLRAELPEAEEPEPESEPEPEAAEAEPPSTEPSTEAQYIGQPGGDQRVEPSEATVREPDPVAQEQTAEPDAQADALAFEPKPRRGFWGWLFRSRTERATPEPVAAITEPAAAPEPEPAGAAPEPEPAGAAPEPESAAATSEPERRPVGAALESEPVAAPQSEPVAAEPEPEPVAADPAALVANPDPDALGDADALDPERVRVILDEALDALGAAHHRPFSRG
jgi:hypothetical protein